MYLAWIKLKKEKNKVLAFDTQAYTVKSLLS